MRGVFWVSALLATVGLSGCTEDVSRTPSGLDSHCRAGPGDHFFRGWYDGGGGPDSSVPYFFSIDRAGVLFHFQGSQAPGSGLVKTTGGSVHGVAALQIKKELQDFGFYHANRDYQVQVAYRYTPAASDVAALCTTVQQVFYGLAPSYIQGGDADASWYNMNVSTDRGYHASRAYNGDGSAEFKDVSAKFKVLADAGEAKYGAGCPTC